MNILSERIRIEKREEKVYEKFTINNPTKCNFVYYIFLVFPITDKP